MPKHLRCHLCVDATGELADISCGDAWLPEFQGQETPWSILLARTEAAHSLLTDLARQGHATLEPVTAAQVVESQRINLGSKKVRQRARRRFYGLTGHALPEFDGSYGEIDTGIGRELKVFLSHKFKELVQLAGLYPAFLAWKAILRKRR